MYLVRKHDIDYNDAKRSVLHELQSANILYFRATSAHSAHIKKNCERHAIAYDEDSDVDDVLYVLDNPQKRDIGVQISPVQFLRDRKLGIRNEKYGIVIRDSVSDWSLLARQKVYL